MVLASLSDVATTLDRLAPTLLDGALRGTVILAVAGIAALSMRRASAAARHWVWMLGFAGLLVMPVLAATMPGWRVLPRVAADAETASPAGTIAIITPPEAEPEFVPMAGPVEKISAVANASPTAPVAASVLPPTPALEPTRAAAEPEAPRLAAAPAPVTAPVLAATITPSPAPIKTSPNSPIAIPWAVWLVVAWLAGTLLVLAHVALGNVSLWWLQRQCTRVTEGPWNDLLHHLRKELHVRRSVTLLCTTRRTMPMTWGLWRACLLLPAQAAEWSVEQRRAVLLHELGHVCRRDCLTQLLAQIACAMHWFNPLAWFAWRRMQMERELACDDLVLSTGGKASAYAEHLLNIASAAPALRFAGAAVAMARPSTLEERLRAILKGDRNRRGLTTTAVLIMILLFCITLLPVATLQAQEAAAPPAEAPRVIPPAPRPPPPVEATPPTEATQTTPNNLPTLTPVPTNPNPNAGRGRRGFVNEGGFGGGGVRGGFDGGGGGGRGNDGGFGGGGGANFGGAGVSPFNPNGVADSPTVALDATIYDVRIPVDQIGKIDINALNAEASGSAETFEKALASLGTSLPLYRASQSVRLAGDFINIATEMPHVTNSMTTAGGQVVNSVSYRAMGARFQIAGRTANADRLDVDLAIQISAMSDGDTSISPTVKAMIFRSATLSLKGLVQPRRAFVIVSVDAANTDANGKAVAYVARITLGMPSSSSAPAPR